MRILFSLHQNDQCGAATFRAAPAPEVREVLEPTLTKLDRLRLQAKKGGSGSASLILYSYHENEHTNILNIFQGRYMNILK